MNSLRQRITTSAVRIFAAIGVLTTLLAVLVIFSVIHAEYATPSEPDSVVLVLNFDQPIIEKSESSPLDFAIHEESTPLLDILHAIDRARGDPHAKGLVARFGGRQPSLAQAEEIRAALARFRTSGKFTYAFGSTYGDFGSGNRAYFIASGFENIWLQPVGAVSLTNIAIEAPFGRAALEKIGVHGDFMRREEYKSFSETFMRDDFSPPVRANMQAMVDDFATQIAEGIAEGRKWNVARVRQLMAKGPYTASEALKEGLVTHIAHAEDLEEELKKKAGNDVELASVDEYLAYRGEGGKSKPKARVALIYGTGLIMDHAEGGASDVTGEDMMGADKIAGAFDDAADNKKIKAIIFRVDSPGGSPEASETIRAALMHAQKVGKPVFVSMGGVAASGGYWVAMNADQIIAEPGTITGSIGVLAGKFVIGGLMQKLGINWDSLSSGKNGDLWAMTKEYTPEQRERINAFLDETYRTFTESVASARKIPPVKMPEVAKGRVWTGAQAAKIGLVDQLGGYDVTLGAVRKKLGLKPDDMLAIEQFPPPLSPAEKVLKILKGIGIESAMIRTALVQWQHLQALAGVVWDGEGLSPVVARVPFAIQRVVK